MVGVQKTERKYMLSGKMRGVPVPLFQQSVNQKGVDGTVCGAGLLLLNSRSTPSCVPLDNFTSVSPK